MAEARTIWVELGERTYPVLVGSGVSSELGALLPPSAKKVAIVTQNGLPDVSGQFTNSETFQIADGEKNKNAQAVEALCEGFSKYGLTRADAVVSVGGGLVSDVAGFAASVYHRGIPVVHVPTTLLAQVDAAIGGKTGVNLSTGKNLLGSFWQPKAVVCDLEHLATLPTRELQSGYGEMAKYHFLGANLLRHKDDLGAAVAASVAVKAEFVARDEHELLRSQANGRALLNYGHTLGHALESVGAFDLRHGEAVAIGLAFAAQLSHRLGRISEERVAEHYEVLRSYNLPEAIPSGFDVSQLVDSMKRDKKSHGTLTFVLDSPTGLELVADVNEEVVRSCLKEFGDLS